MTFTVEIKSRPGKNNELYQTLQALLLTMRREKGCMDVRVSRDTGDGTSYALHSVWDRPESIEEYMQSGSGSALIGAIELLCDSSRVRLGEGAAWESVDALKRMRRGE